MGNGITHWLDYPIHDLVLLVQTAVLRDLLASDRLTRLKDLELKSEPGFFVVHFEFWLTKNMKTNFF